VDAAIQMRLCCWLQKRTSRGGTARRAAKAEWSPQSHWGSSSGKQSAQWHYQWQRGPACKAGEWQRLWIPCSRTRILRRSFDHRETCTPPSPEANSRVRI
jgi:hypothetical protein